MGWGKVRILPWKHKEGEEPHARQVRRDPVEGCEASQISAFKPRVLKPRVSYLWQASEKHSTGM